MGLFGDIDVTEVPEDPWYVEDGTYLCSLAEIKKIGPTANGGYGLAFKWVIIEDDSEFEGNNIQDWKNIYPDLTADDLTKEIKADLSRLKQRLVQIGVPEEDLGDFGPEYFADYEGTEAYVTVKNSVNSEDPSKKYRNVTFVRLPEE